MQRGVRDERDNGRVGDPQPVNPVDPQFGVDDRAVVRAVVELCDSLGLVTVAEGVEKASQAFALETLGVQQVQGYFHSRPMNDLATADWLASRPVASLADR